jgi:predicted RNase H-like nuclease
MYFVGIDLAWSPKNLTGIAVINGDRRKAVLKTSKIVLSDSEIMDFLKENLDEKAFIAIDAPLIVPNQTGRRLAEKLVGERFRKYNAGAHPANRQRLSSWSGKIRGEELSDILEKAGFQHNPYIKKFENKNKFFEVYPHPSMVVLFKLDKILQYKAKPKRDYTFRHKEFRKYQKNLKRLENSDTPLFLPDEIIRRNLNRLKGKALKGYEDMLDAIFCAYIAYYSWKNPEKCKVLGNMKKGYIFTPVFGKSQENC